MATYVDGFLMAVPHANAAAYRRLARKAGKIWMEYGALSYMECMADDVKPGKLTSFPQAVKLKADEAVWASALVGSDGAVPGRADDRAGHHHRERGPALHPADLGFSETSLVWVVNAYMLTFGGFLLLGGRLGDLLGTGACSWGHCAVHRGVAGLRAWRTRRHADRGARGAGPGRRGGVGRGAVAHHEPVHRAGRTRRAMGVYGFVCAGGGSIGVLLGGLLTSAFSWHWIFLVNLPIGVAVYAGCACA
jgi:uncharacterized protein YbaA (DUF1428 family)